MNVEQAPKILLCKPTLLREEEGRREVRNERKTPHLLAPGYWRQHAHKGDGSNTGSSNARSTDVDQRGAGDGKTRRGGMAERFVVAVMPGNAGGAKEPQFKTNARRNNGTGD